MLMRLEAPAVRAAQPEDAADLAQFVLFASEGLSARFWAGLAGPGEAPIDVGRRRIRDGEGEMSWRNAVVAELGGRVAGGLYSRHIGAERPLDGIPAIFRPLQALENLAVGTRYVHVLATHPEFRRRGVGSRLLAEAERAGRGTRGLSLVVADRNHAARRLYEAWGFAEEAQAPMVKDGWESGSSRWILMLRPAG